MNLLDNEKNEINYILRELEKNISNQEDEAIKNKYIDLKSQYYRQRESQNTLANLTKTYLSTGLFLIVLAVSLLVESGADTIILQVLLAGTGIIPIVSAEETINMSKKNKIELKQTINDIIRLSKEISIANVNKKTNQIKAENPNYSYSYSPTDSKIIDSPKENSLVKTKRKQ